MKPTTLAAALAITGLSFLAGPAAAQSDDSGGQANGQSSEAMKQKSKAPAFEDVDQNGDGVVTAEEAMAVDVTKTQIADADLDNNGELSKVEWNFIEYEINKP